MNTQDIVAMFGERGIPPAKLKIFAPDGNIVEAPGWLGTRSSELDPGHQELHLISPDGTSELLNRKVVILNVELGVVVYSPRLMNPILGLPQLTKREQVWLERNPQWPGILELDDQPVENGEDNEGIKG